MYFVEHGDNAVAGQTGVYDVSPHELASRLSYQLWQTAPDDALLAAAADGSLRTAAVYDAQVTRLLADARARPALDEFFADWMKVEDLPAMDAKNADADVQDVRGRRPARREAAPGDDRRRGRDARLLHLDDAVGRRCRCSPATCRSRATRAWPSSTASPAWNGTGAPPALPAGQRPGLLTRALFLSTGSANTRPIMKGVFLRTNVLCDTIPPPPPGANAKPPELVPGMTTRESVEALTEMAGTTCAGCHTLADQPARLRDRGLRRARALPDGAAAVRRGGRRDRDQAGEHVDASRRWSSAIRRRSRRRPS